MSDTRPEYAPGRRQGDAGTSPGNYPRGGQVAAAERRRPAEAAPTPRARRRFGVFVAGDYDRMTNLRPWAARRPASLREETQYWPCCRALPVCNWAVTAGARYRQASDEKRATPARRQPRAADLCDHAGQHHAGARHHDRQRGAAAYPRQSVGLARSDLLGADVVHRRRGDHDAADRLARRPVRHQNRICALGRGLHLGLGPVRQCHEPDRARPLPHAARGVRRRARAADASGAAPDQPARAAWPGDGGVWHRNDIGADLRPGARRLADLRLQLALGFLYQSAVRCHRHPRHADLRPRQPPGPSRAV